MHDKRDREWRIERQSSLPPNITGLIKFANVATILLYSLAYIRTNKEM